MILLVALTGNVGKNGGGFNHYVGQERVWPEHGFKMLAFPEGARSSASRTRRSGPTATSKQQDPHLIDGKPIEHYILESVRNGWMPLWPKKRLGQAHAGGHARPSAQAARPDRLAGQLPQPGQGQRGHPRSLWKDLDLIVDINYRMDTTALYSDVVLPGVELLREDRSQLDRLPLLHAPVLARCSNRSSSRRTDWDIFGALAQKIEELARKRGLAPYVDEDAGLDAGLQARLHDDWTGQGKIATDEDAANFILANSPETQGNEPIKDCRSSRNASSRSTPKPGTATSSPVRAYTPFTHQIEKKRPWRTLTGRQQFYIDHEWFLALGEAAPDRTRIREDDPEYPALLEHPARALVDPLHLAGQPLHASTAARRADRLHPPRRRRAARHSRTTTGCASTTARGARSCRRKCCPERSPADSPCTTAGRGTWDSRRAAGSRSPTSRSSRRSSSAATASSPSASTTGGRPATTATSRWTMARYDGPVAGFDPNVERRG